MPAALKGPVQRCFGTTLSVSWKCFFSCIFLHIREPSRNKEVLHYKCRDQETACFIHQIHGRKFLFNVYCLLQSLLCQTVEVLKPCVYALLSESLQHLEAITNSSWSELLRMLLKPIWDNSLLFCGSSLSCQLFFMVIWCDPTFPIDLRSPRGWGSQRPFGTDARGSQRETVKWTPRRKHTHKSPVCIISVPWGMECMRKNEQAIMDTSTRNTGLLSCRSKGQVKHSDGANGS